MSESPKKSTASFFIVFISAVFFLVILTLALEYKPTNIHSYPYYLNKTMLVLLGFSVLVLLFVFINRQKNLKGMLIFLLTLCSINAAFLLIGIIDLKGQPLGSPDRDVYIELMLIGLFVLASLSLLFAITKYTSDKNR